MGIEPSIGPREDRMLAFFTKRPRTRGKIGVRCRGRSRSTVEIIRSRNLTYSPWRKYEWLDKDEAENLKTPAPKNFGQNVHHQIDRQNTQLEQIEPNSTDQNPSLTEFVHSGQIEPNSTDQNPSLTEFDHSDNANSSESIVEDEQKQLGISFATIQNWKRELGQIKPKKYSHSEQKELLKRYYEIKDKTPKISDESIVKMLKIGRRTLCSWKKQFERPQFQPNSVDVGYSVEENAAANS
uniref:Transposase n=1 Tax=Globodera rostochiensis TaxID=31243 RepID=A0A914H436_GLORO